MDAVRSAMSWVFVPHWTRAFCWVFESSLAGNREWCTVIPPQASGPFVSGAKWSAVAHRIQIGPFLEELVSVLAERSPA